MIETTKFFTTKKERRMGMNLMILDAEFAVKRALRKVFREENGEVNIVTTVVLIGIAVMLAALFRQKAGELINTLFTTISNKANTEVTATP